MSESVRLDKWLWAARFFKTRSLATEAVDSGKVKLGGDKVKPARAVRVGDTLDIDNGSDRWEVDVMNLSDVRAAAPIARNLYEETDASVARRADVAENRRLYREPGADIKGRPTKRDRRQLGKAGGYD
ncbi:RNA-binding S4 domain-containing protein [Duganella sp. BJB488]|uniref:RNA-binding S4 domain-containing protein n=1 Tax=Duganella vulcania TaxID=2692166 RepID=A0A845HPY6_9BURK|nr:MULTISPECIES: S4 domain-containing protein [Duganella]MYN20868.1 RNA-binding S4 domain-containing protein [Duganella vulcania]NVD72186.1 RNA-binding S4 domain-containing protein [Duganella sp. BJB1802]RFP14026.1 RNA-binding S4 domain-containing protein [Duganella sp. BJB489]RFP17390.1 RNA-binding S4 domain-containing protein [Duganella sp. BJB488]RFP31820.1 RNA-binding S4 domain-containing protein [Duganella sp. BJB480]